jgi:hypothetical protein
MEYRNYCVYTLTRGVEAFERESFCSDNRLKKMKVLFKLLRSDFYEPFLKKYPNFREVVKNKAAEMRNPATFYHLTASLEVKVALINEAKRLQKRLAL